MLETIGTSEALESPRVLTNGDHTLIVLRLGSIHYFNVKIFGLEFAYAHCYLHTYYRHISTYRKIENILLTDYGPVPISIPVEGSVSMFDSWPC